MDHDFWHSRWEKNEIGFHQPEGHPLFQKHWSALKLAPGSTVFVPLCGKSPDLHWLLQQGYQVTGAELSPLAAEQLFAALSLTPSRQPCGQAMRLSAGRLHLLVGDLFTLQAEDVGPTDAVYDRAALIALPDAMRSDYARQIVALTDAADQLLISLSYDESVMAGPPFAVGDAEIHRHYQAQYQITELETEQNARGLKGRWPAAETVWHLRSRRR